MNPPRVVFDAVVFVQALISGRGPSAACIERVLAGEAVLFLNDPILSEITSVPLRPELTRRYRHLTPERVNGFVRDIRAVSVQVLAPSGLFKLPRDAKDEPYVDLAIAIEAEYIVTWNERHLTYLMSGDTPEGSDFLLRFPGIVILSPPAFLAVLRARHRS